ncbi:MAG TPA: hypothetical protein VGI83_09695 [Gemmatimonadales bacterium]|jgi:hypothetical protein
MNRISHIALAGLVLAVAACSDMATPTGAETPSLGKDGTGQGNPGLLFNGVDANTSTPANTVITQQIADVSIDVTVKFLGANAANAHQTLFYNGNGAVTGWGILILGEADGFPTGTISYLAGGLTIVPTGFTLREGKWDHLRMTRDADQRVTFTFNDSTVDLGLLPARAIDPAGDPGHFGRDDHTSVGGDGTFNAPTGSFNGVIDDLIVTDLTTGNLIDRWKFDEGSGPTATGQNGNVLTLGTTQWIRHGDAAKL